MVGIVIVSHSEKLADAVVDYTRSMAGDAPIAAAGGTDDGGFGTSFDKINKAIDAVYSEDGVMILMDMGSAVMTTEMVLDSRGQDNIKMVDCPLVEGAFAAYIGVQSSMTMDEIIESLKDLGGKF